MILKAYPSGIKIVLQGNRYSEVTVVRRELGSSTVVISVESFSIRTIATERKKADKIPKRQIEIHGVR